MINILRLDYKSCIKNKNIKISLSLLLSLSLLHFLSVFIFIYKNKYSQIPYPYDLTILSGGFGTEFFNLYSILIPFVSCIIYSDCYIKDFNDGPINFILTKTSKLKYIISKLITIAIFSFLVIFITLMINIILIYTIIPLINKNYIIYADQHNHNILNTLKNNSPYVYNVFLAFVNSIIGSAISIFCYSISFTFNNIKNVLLFLITYVFFFLYSMIVEILNANWLSLYFYQSGYGSFNGFLITIFIWLSISICIIFINYFKRDISI